MHINYAWSFILNSKVSNRIIAKLLRRYENYILRRRSTIFIVLAKQLTVGDPRPLSPSPPPPPPPVRRAPV